MQIRINVKGEKRKKAAIVQTTCDYPDRQMTVEEFLEETVRQNVRDYNARKDAAEILRLFSNEDGKNRPLNEQFEEHIQNSAASGKVAYGDPMDGRKADEEKAVENALQCFDDGMVALFADGVRYTEREEKIALKELSEVTFIRLTFLAGRMW